MAMTLRERSFSPALEHRPSVGGQLYPPAVPVKARCTQHLPITQRLNELAGHQKKD
jgi:hypothetical protein